MHDVVVLVFFVPVQVEFELAHILRAELRIQRLVGVVPGGHHRIPIGRDVVAVVGALHLQVIQPQHVIQWVGRRAIVGVRFGRAGAQDNNQAKGDGGGQGARPTGGQGERVGHGASRTAG